MRMISYRYTQGGFHKVCTELVQKISESSVLTNQTVESIQQASDQKSAIVRTNGGKEFSAKRVICAVPNNHLGMYGSLVIQDVFGP